MSLYSEYYLSHHGIKGQKWGVRRFQNKDGTLTNAGKKRLKKLEDVRDREIDLARRRRESEEESIKRKTKDLENAKSMGPKGLAKYVYGHDTDDKIMDLSGMTIQELYDGEIKYWQHAIGVSKARVRGYMEQEKALTNMTIDDLSISKKDIIAKGRQAMVGGWADYDNENPDY